MFFVLLLLLFPSLCIYMTFEIYCGSASRLPQPDYCAPLVGIPNFQGDLAMWCLRANHKPKTSLDRPKQ